MKFNYEFKAEELEYLRKLGIKSIDNFVKDVNDKKSTSLLDVFSVDLFREAASLNKDEIEALEDSERKNIYLAVKNLLNDAGIVEPNIEKNSIDYKHYVLDVTEFAVGIKAKLSDKHQYYESALFLTREDYVNIKKSENKTEKEIMLLQAYDELCTYDLVPKIPENITEIANQELDEYLNTYNHVFSDDLDLKTDILKFSELKFDDFLIAVTEKEEYLTDNQKIIKEFIEVSLGLGDLNVNITNTSKATYMMKVLFTAAAFMDIKEGKNLVDVYKTNYFNVDSIQDKNVKEKINTLRINAENFEKYPRIVSKNIMELGEGINSEDLNKILTDDKDEKYVISEEIVNNDLSILKGKQEEIIKEKNLITEELQQIDEQIKNIEELQNKDYLSKEEQRLLLENLSEDYINEIISDLKKSMDELAVSEDVNNIDTKDLETEYKNTSNIVSNLESELSIYSTYEDTQKRISVLEKLTSGTSYDDLSNDEQKLVNNNLSIHEYEESLNDQKQRLELIAERNEKLKKAKEELDILKTNIKYHYFKLIIEILTKIKNKEELTEEEKKIVSSKLDIEDVKNQLEIFNKKKELLNNNLKDSNERELTIKNSFEFVEKNIKNSIEKDKQSEKNKIDKTDKEKIDVEPIDEEEEIKRVERRTDLLEKFRKFLVFGVGFGTGIALSCVPGIGTIRMVAAAAKLVNSGINLWTKKHPEGKIAEIINATKDKIKNKFPGITNKLEILKEKFKKVPLNLFVNGVSAGYLVGNVVEFTTRKTVFEHFKPGDKVIDATDVNPDKVLTDNADKVIDKTPVAEPTFSFQPGETIDLSNIKQGYVYSGSNNPVNLITSVGKNAVVDRIVTTPNGEKWIHLLQSDGKTYYAWFKLSDLEAAVEKGIAR